MQTIRFEAVASDRVRNTRISLLRVWFLRLIRDNSARSSQWDLRTSVMFFHSTAVLPKGPRQCTGKTPCNCRSMVLRGVVRFDSEIQFCGRWTQTGSSSLAWHPSSSGLSGSGSAFSGEWLTCSWTYCCTKASPNASLPLQLKRTLQVDLKKLNNGKLFIICELLLVTCSPSSELRQLCSECFQYRPTC